MAFARLLGEKQTRENGIILKAGILYAIMNWHERIVADPGVLAGKPVIRGTRMAVEFVLDLLANGWSEAEIIRNYPRLNRHVLVTPEKGHDILSISESLPQTADEEILEIA